MQPVQVNTSQAAIQEAIGLAVFEDKQGIINLLRNNGAKIEDTISDDNLIKITYLAIAKSNGFKKDFSEYLVGRFSEEQVGYVDDTEFFNQTGKEKRLAKKTTRVATRKEAGGSKVGLALKNVATSENINALVNSGLGILSQKLTAKADQKSIQAATELAAQKSEQALSEAQVQEQKAKGRKWVVPVVIGAVLIVGVIAYFVIRKKK